VRHFLYDRPLCLQSTWITSLYKPRPSKRNWNSKLSSVISVFLPALLATSYLPLVTLISLRDFEHVNPTKTNGFYSAATMRMGPAATTNRFPQISFIPFTQWLVLLETYLYLNVLFEHNFHTHNPLMSLILPESQHIKLLAIHWLRTYVSHLTTTDNPYTHAITIATDGEPVGHRSFSLALG
jgi:hypothetical protein